MLDVDLKRILACPVCRAKLVYYEDTETLRCFGCGKLFIIREGIPNFIPEVNFQ